MSLLKALINSLTDFEFLSAISTIDFHNKKILFKRHFWNSLIKTISKNVDITSERDLHGVIQAIKSMCFTRLGLVSPHSMKRFFLQNIPMVFEAFQHRILGFFRKLKDGPKSPKSTKLSEEEKLVLKKERKREARRRNRNNRRQRNLLEQKVSFEKEKSAESESTTSEQSSNEENLKRVDDDEDLIRFKNLLHLGYKSGHEFGAIMKMLENYPEFGAQILEDKCVLRKVLNAHIDDQSSEEEETEEEEESSEEDEDEE